MMVDALGGGGLKGLQMREAFADICSVDNPVDFLTRLSTDPLASVIDAKEPTLVSQR